MTNVGGRNATRLRALGRFAGAAVLLAVIAGTTAQAGPADAPVTGLVFRDFDADGIRDTREPGERGVIVRAVDRTGAEFETTTSANGTYSLNVTTLDAGPYRIEFDLPAGATWLAEGAHGSGNGTSVQFAVPGGTANFAVSNPDDYCQANPRLITSCFTGGDPLAGNSVTANRSALKSFPYTATGDLASNPPITDEATAAQLGATWGLAADRATGDVFISSLVKRHAGLGPGGVDAIYRKPAGGGAPTVWFNGVATDNAAVPSNSARGLAAAGSPSYDTAVFPLVGTRGWGDIDMAEDGSGVYAVNLFDRKVYKIDRTGTTSAALPDPNYPVCTNGVARPWGLGVQDGQVLLGVVCSGENGGTRTDLTAQVLRLDVATSTWGTPAFASPISLNYQRGCATTWFSPAQGCAWNPWTNVWDKPTFAPSGGTDISTDQRRRVSYPVPMLSDIEFDDDGSLILAFMDRSGHMFGIDNWAPAPPLTALFTVDIGGDLLRAGPPAIAGGSYTLESNGSAPLGAGLGGGTITSGTGNNQGPGGGEFYRFDLFGSAHQETSEGAVALVKGRGEVATTQMDPFAVHSAGIVRFSNVNATATGRLELLPNSRSPIGFGKANAIGDLEVLCELAPIEIGNRVWVDTDNDGVQDPDEAPLAGISVDLYVDNDADGQPDGGAISTAVTDATGTYYFSGAAGTSTARARFGIAQLVPGARVIVGVPASTVLPGGATGVLTVQDVPGADDRVDSDGAILDGRSRTTTLGGAGRNDHSLDFGYVQPPPPTTTTTTTTTVPPTTTTTTVPPTTTTTVPPTTTTVPPTTTTVPPTTTTVPPTTTTTTTTVPPTTTTVPPTTTTTTTTVPPTTTTVPPTTTTVPPTTTTTTTTLPPTTTTLPPTTTTAPPTTTTVPPTTTTLPPGSLVPSTTTTTLPPGSLVPSTTTTLPPSSQVGVTTTTALASGTVTTELPSTGSSGIVTILFMGLGCIVVGAVAQRIRRT